MSPPISDLITLSVSADWEGDHIIYESTFSREMITQGTNLMSWTVEAMWELMTLRGVPTHASTGSVTLGTGHRCDRVAARRDEMPIDPITEAEDWLSAIPLIGVEARRSQIDPRLVRRLIERLTTTRAALITALENHTSSLGLVDLEGLVPVMEALGIPTGKMGEDVRAVAATTDQTYTVFDAEADGDMG